MPRAALLANQRSRIGENMTPILLVPRNWMENRTTRMADVMPTIAPVMRKTGCQVPLSFLMA